MIDRQQPLDEEKLDVIVNQIVSDIPIKIKGTGGKYFQAMDLRRLLQDNLAANAEKTYDISPQYSAFINHCRGVILAGCNRMAESVSDFSPQWNLPPKGKSPAVRVSEQTEQLALTAVTCFLPEYAVIVAMGAQIENKIASMDPETFRQRFGDIRDPNRKAADNPNGDISQQEAAKEIAGGFVFGMAQQISRIFLNDDNLKKHFEPIFLGRLGQLISIMTTDARLQILENPNISAREVLDIIRSVEMANPKNQLHNFGIRFPQEVANDNLIKQELERGRAARDHALEGAIDVKPVEDKVARKSATEPALSAPKVSVPKSAKSDSSAILRKMNVKPAEVKAMRNAEKKLEAMRKKTEKTVPKKIEAQHASKSKDKPKSNDLLDPANPSGKRSPGGSSN